MKEEKLPREEQLRLELRNLTKVRQLLLLLLLQPIGLRE
jgi:hypothetical protein